MDLIQLEGIGPKSLKLLNKLNINTIDDLISYYPFRYDVLKVCDLNNALNQDKVIVNGIIESIPTVIRLRGNMNKMSFRIITNNLLVKVVIFNRGFMKKHFEVGKKIVVIGKWDNLKNTITASDFRFDQINGMRIEPVYRTTNNLSKKNLSNYINNALNMHLNEMIDYIPDEYIKKYEFLSKEYCVKTVHNPKSIEELKKAQIRLKYEELFLFMLKINYLRNKNINQNIGLERKVNKKNIDKFIKTLPFELTTDQIKAVDDIYNDLILPKRMNRLIQGDVGSGKTIVSIIACYINYLSGYQSALMAPTEILATQHFSNIKNIFRNININIGLLTGSMKQKEKKEIYKKLNNGEIDLIVGTHTLIQDNVEYKNLGLVITDEQHRFGVNQRSNLKNKGIMPDVLYMSATPIPRTYALTIYGDMNISNIKTRPKGRKDIITYVKSSREIKDVLYMMKDELELGHQIYVIAPLIEESDKSNLKNINELHDKLKMAFKHYNVDILHGKMKNEEKDEIMDRFSHNEINILISTTVIEVGVDVENATMMVIFDAHQFGLSTLHQLRGRVGRNQLQSFCILISDGAKERLSIMESTNDGFKISEEDFKLRGHGDLFGVKQSGDMTFKIANIKEDFKILLQAKEDSNEFLNKCKFDTFDKNNIYYNILKNIENLD